jgi:hypothetical protein
VPSDGEQPGAELVDAALPELGQVADDLQPGLAGHVIDVVATDDLEVAQQPRLQRVPQEKEARLIARPGANEGMVDRGAARFGPHRAHLIPYQLLPEC